MLLVPKPLLIGGAVVVVGYLYSIGGDAQGASTAPTSGTGQCKMSVTADVLNIRSAPDINAGVVGKIKLGGETLAGTTVQNGYRMLGPNRWASNDFLKALPGHTC